jgi:hypothetical protein
MKLTSNARKKIANKNFALSGRRYPIEDKNHARNALARASQNATPAEQEEIERKVHAKFPGIGKKKRVGDRMKGGR